MYYYVYRIIDKKRKKYYIGSRQSKVPPKEDLGISYFGSSSNKNFADEQKKEPENFIYDVVEIFSDFNEASKYENQLIQEYNALNDERYYNGRTRLKTNTSDSRITKSIISYLGNLIKLARKEHGLSQQELAERINGSRSLIQRIELGNTKVAIGSVFEACFILGIPLMGCGKDHINNLSKMLAYMNKLIPENNIPNKNISFNDDF